MNYLAERREAITERIITPLGLRGTSFPTTPETGKYRNLRANPAVAMSVGDLACPDRYIEVQGEVVGFALFETLAWINQLARK